MQPKRPNILWVSFEDTNPFYGCYDDPVARTPNLDRLAAEGIRYTHAFSTAGVSAPARSAIITGMYPISIGTHHMRSSHTNPATPELPTPYSAVVPHYVKCFTEYLRAGGYFCSNNQKTDYQFETPLTAWDELGPQAHWRNRPDPEQPFFAVFNPVNTHESGQWDSKTPDVTFDPADVPLPPYFPDTEKVRLAIARMYTQIERSDAFLGQLLQELEEDGVSENTIVMHWSDHGPLPRGKRWPYDSGIHVPLIVRGAPGTEQGAVSERLVSTMDLGPTVLSLCDIPVPAHMQGQAFLGRQEAAPRKYTFASRDRYDEAYDKVRAARSQRFKYIRHDHPELPYMIWNPYYNRHPIAQELWRLYLEDKLEGPQRLLFEPRPVEELYDTENDPFEIDNLAGDPALQTILEEMRSATSKWTAEVGDLGLIDEAEMVRRWYPDGKQPHTAEPRVIVYDRTGGGLEPVRGGTFEAPAAIHLHCPTQGASIAWTLDAGSEARWQLYGQPIRLAPGEYQLRTRAIRIGFKESNEATCLLTVLAKSSPEA